MEFTSIVVLVTPYISCGSYSKKNERGLPSVKLVREWNKMGTKVILVDSFLIRKINESVKDEWPGSRTLDELKEESNINELLELHASIPSMFDWSEIKSSEVPVLYVAYDDRILPSNVPDELYVMKTVEDYGFEDRKYVRNLGYNEVTKLIMRKNWESNKWCHINSSIVDHKETYVMILESYVYYIKNKFNTEDHEMKYSRCQSDFIFVDKSERKSFPLNLNQPLFTCFIDRYNLYPVKEKVDKWKEIKCGVTANTKMQNCSDYRRKFTYVMSVFLDNALINDGIIEPNEVNWNDLEQIESVFKKVLS